MAASSNSSSLFDTTALQSLQNARVAIVSTEWNEAIISKLIEGSSNILSQFNATITHNIKVPGAVELTYACKAIGSVSHPPEAIIAFGAVIRGGTPHFEYVCKSVTEGITQLNLILDIPVIFGVLTLDTEEQAYERLGGPHGHKGEEAALAALKMIALSRSLSAS
jgi:6,7-dimethyl-8-ribityllumazine synthase